MAVELLFHPTRRDCGWIADWCPICGELRAHRVQRVGIALHVIVIPLGEGAFEAFEAVCLTCLAVREIDEDDFDAFAGQYSGGLASLIAQTLPRRREDPQEDRADAIRHRLSVLSHQVAYHRANTEFSPRGKLVGAFGGAQFLLTVLAVVGGIPLGFIKFNRAWLVWIGVSGALMICAAVYSMASAYPWFLKTRFRPQLQRAFRDSPPTIHELDVALAELPEDDVLAGKHFGAAKLHEWIG